MGKTAKASAQQLGLSPRTVESYLETVKHKFNVSNKSDLIEKIFDSF
jgi:DNA-binding CsgD family transcriptional regulator